MSEPAAKKRIPAFVVGLVVPIAYSNIGHVLGIWNSPWLSCLLVILYVATGAYIWRGTFRSSLGSFVAVLLAVPIGVLVDVNIDWFIREFDRNLFPFEIVFLWVVTPVCLLIGMGARKLLRSKTKLERCIVSHLKKFLPNENNRRLFPSFIAFCVAGSGAALGFTASALSVHWLGIVALAITVLGVLGGFIFILHFWWHFFRGEAHNAKGTNVK